MILQFGCHQNKNEINVNLIFMFNYISTNLQLLSVSNMEKKIFKKM